MGLLHIYACDKTGNQDYSNKIALQINPTSINIDLENNYSDQRGMGTIGSEQKFTKSEPGALSFKTIIDSTGTIGETSFNVLETIQKINSLCYRYNGEKHEPNKVIVVWGDIHFKGNLNKLNISYKLFTPDGKLLRAELDFSFREFTSSKEEAMKKNQSSPDITHIVTVLAGTNLPSLCNNVYKNNKLFTIIARVNDLTDFRCVKSGAKIVFPPLK